MSAAPQVKNIMSFDLEITAGPHAGQKMTVTKGTVTIGRGPENDIVLSLDPRASRQHAEIKVRDSELLITNLSQKNFVMVNGQNIVTEVLTETSVIQMGDSEFRIHLPAPAVVSAPPVSAPPPILEPLAPKPLRPASPQMYAPPAGPAPAAPRRPVSGGAANQGLLQNPKVRFYGIVAILGAVAWFLLSPSANKTKKDPNAFRTSSLSMADVAEAEKRSQELLTIKKEKYDSIQYRRAQENFIKGFRDLQQGQYARARESFQVVLNLDPENELAKRYYHLAKIKFDELVKFNMIQGNRYREKKNWRMCQSNYSNVMTMLQYRKDDPSFKEAKQFYEECSLNLEGRF